MEEGYEVDWKFRRYFHSALCFLLRPYWMDTDAGGDDLGRHIVKAGEEIIPDVSGRNGDGSMRKIRNEWLRKIARRSYETVCDLTRD